ncbi:Xylose isomerase domain protein TIM barrel [Pirellula staleyi DSM 6068]|uniref:Xylose isomerase domain protein TIM barrel n=1 Tax=Pirellula staleyi (strain ATCC 27377 / DSM 6068 / ICPB 4128) TaxID=530564 RepID=D2R2P8_PIRSD|nr:sugar phosphate isomerase/epimerase family protein [Pirellula staleyi]ADB16888.1 Xylose isomerase domain protein TIM barrel [Pirellula staleyi DSM 6068]
MSSTHLRPASLDRRQMLQSTTLAAAAWGVSSMMSHAEEPTAPLAATAKLARRAEPVKYCLNMSTVRGQSLSVPQQVKLAADAGYAAIEPWLGDLNKYLEAGGTTAELKKMIADAGLTVDSAIGFAEWIVDDDERRAKGLEQAKRDMQLIADIGGTHIAAPPAGATNQTDLNLFKAAERYRKLLEIGVEIGVIPQVEVWGFSKSLSRLGETMFVAVESGHPAACILPDVYHIYKGGSDFAGLDMIRGAAIHCFHMNDYPADPPRETIKDADRVFPGDGIAPITKILKNLFAGGFSGTLSLELFNPEYWKRPALEVAQEGLAKMKASVEKAIAS